MRQLGGARCRVSKPRSAISRPTSFGRRGRMVAFALARRPVNRTRMRSSRRAGRRDRMRGIAAARSERAREQEQSRRAQSEQASMPAKAVTGVASSHCCFDEPAPGPSACSRPGCRGLRKRITLLGRCRSASRGTNAAQRRQPRWPATCGSPGRSDSPTPRSRRSLLVRCISREVSRRCLRSRCVRDADLASQAARDSWRVECVFQGR